MRPLFWVQVLTEPFQNGYWAQIIYLWLYCPLLTADLPPINPQAARRLHHVEGTYVRHDLKIATRLASVLMMQHKLGHIPYPCLRARIVRGTLPHVSGRVDCRDYAKDTRSITNSVFGWRSQEISARRHSCEVHTRGRVQKGTQLQSMPSDLIASSLLVWRESCVRVMTPRTDGGLCLATQPLNLRLMYQEVSSK